MAFCPAFDPLGPFVRGVVDFVDCHAVALGEEGYRALGAETAFGYALSGLLTIYVALIGYRLLLGEAIRLREGVMIALRVGIVLALASQWSAYQPLVYNVATRGPEDIAARILAPGGLGGESMAGLTNRLQGVNSVLAGMAHPDLSRLTYMPDEEGQGATQPRAGNAQGEGAQAQRPPLPLVLQLEQRKTVATANTMLLVATLAGIVSVHVVIGLLLALGPLLVACFLFEALRGLFVGWVRVLAGAAMGGIAIPAVIALELAVLEPQVVALQRQLDAREIITQLPTQIMATTGLFAIVLFATLFGVARVAAGFRLPAALRHEIMQVFQRSEMQVTGRALPGAALPALAIESRSRAHVIADAVSALERREERVLAAAGSGMRSYWPRSESMRGGTPAASTPAQPLGQAGRRTTPRQSTGGKRRDGLK